MDTFLFIDRVSEGQSPVRGPDNSRRHVVYFHSLWFNGDQCDGPYERFDDFLSNRGWDEEALLVGQWRDAHRDNARKDPVKSCSIPWSDM